MLGTIRNNPTKFPKLQIIHSEGDPIGFPVVVVLPASGLRLQFDGIQQYLRLVEVLEWGKYRLTYKGIELGRQGSVTFKQVYSKVFGPTYPGVHNVEKGTYVLSYPGVAFTFPIPKDCSDVPDSSEGLIKYLSNHGECSSMAIFKGHSWPEVFDKLFDASDDLPYKEKVEIDYIEASPAMDRKCIFSFLKHPDDVRQSTIGLYETTMQEMIVLLGPPSERFLKQDSRLSIHNPNSTISGTQLFFNYYHLGIDACFDTTYHVPRLCKLIIHGNLPGSLGFLKYRRCRWRLAGSTSETAFSDFYQFERKPMILNQSLDSPSSSVELVGEPEILPMEDWGGTSLYGSPGCVFEVLGNSVASLTIY